MNRQPIRLIVSTETFRTVFMDDTARTLPATDAPDCPVVKAAGYTKGSVSKCDCSNELRAFALASPHGHPCGENGKCPVRTFLNVH